MTLLEEVEHVIPENLKGYYNLLLSNDCRPELALKAILLCMSDLEEVEEKANRIRGQFEMQHQTSPPKRLLDLVPSWVFPNLKHLMKTYSAKDSIDALFATDNDLYKAELLLSKNQDIKPMEAKSVIF